MLFNRMVPLYSEDLKAYPIFPFDVPRGLLLQPNSQLGCHRLSSAAIRTKRGITNTATQIQALQQSEGKLKYVRSCPSFWGNLVKYASHEQTVTVVNPRTAQPNPVLQALNTWRLPVQCRVPLPTREQQAQGLKALAGWYLSHINRATVIPKMNSELSIQGEVLAQIIEPLNCFLKIRYPSLKVEEAELGYPQWGRACSEAHLTPGKRNNAGFPDFLLIRSSQKPDHGAIREIKTWWAYHNSDFYDILAASTVSQPGGEFVDSQTTSAKVLRQLWGQMHFFNCHLGFCTNGKVIILCAKAGPDTIVLSPPKPWDDPEVHQALIGLGYAGVDMRHLLLADLINYYLC
ncbi:hypothetical protein M422DRAFT_65765, partial [Sphaerobolus stellatus SS14]